jgi:hypothetical protein
VEHDHRRHRHSHLGCRHLRADVLFDVTLNIMSLGGLALGIGMLVDNSIVVLESIHRLREEGHDLFTAAIRGTSVVGGAVIASTLTTVAVFFPIVFVKGVAGQIFGDMALTVVFSLLASLVVALFVVPMLASRMIKDEYLADIRGRFSANHILRLAIVEDFKNFKDRRQEQNASVLHFVAGTVLRFGRELIIKLWVLIAAILLFILKSLALLLLFVPTLLLGWIPKLRKYVRQLEAWSVQPNFRSLTLHQRVWNTLFVFKSYAMFVADWRSFATGFREAKLRKRVARATLSPFYLLYSIARFIIHQLYSTVLKLSLTSIFALAFLLSIVLVLVGMPLGLFFAGLLLVCNPLLNWSYETYPRRFAGHWQIVDGARHFGRVVCSLCVFAITPARRGVDSGRASG